MKALRSIVEAYRWWRHKQSSLPLRIVRGLMHGISLAALILVCLATIVSREITPFYSWVHGTAFEATGRYVVGVITKQTLVWKRRMASLPLLPQEERAREHFISEIIRVRPTHALQLRDGRTFLGNVRDRDDDLLVFDYQDDDSRKTLKPAETEIAALVVLEHAPISLSPKDVRFLTNYPEFDYYHMPPYLVVTSTTYPLVHEAYAILSALSAEFRRAFDPLIVTERKDDLIYVCIFKDEATYLEHATANGDAALARSIGYYSQSQECLFVYDRLRSLARANVDRSLDQLIAESQTQGSDRYARRVRRFAEAERERLYDVLRDQVVTTLRHEGAHELAFSLGVHSSEGFEHLWLQEGLAQYCETVPMGEMIPEQLALLKAAIDDNTLIPWRDLINTPTPTGFGFYGNRTNHAYAQSWILFHHLMQERYRPKLFAYANHIRHMTPAQLERQRTAILEEYLGVPFGKLVDQVEATIRSRGINLAQRHD